MQQRKITQDVSGAAETCQGDRTSSVFRIPAGRGGHQGLSGLLLLVPWVQPALTSSLAPRVWVHRIRTPTRFTISKYRGCAHTAIPCLPISWPGLSHHHDYLPRPPSPGTSNRSSRSQHAFSTDLPWTTPGPGHQDPQVLLPLPG